MTDDQLERITDLSAEGCASPQRTDNFHQHITVIPAAPDRVGFLSILACGLMAGWLLNDLARYLGLT